MVPTFQLHADYLARDVEFVLSRTRKGWEFFGRDAQGYCVPARFLAPDFAMTFPTRERAAQVAKRHNFPAYAVWNGRRRAYDGQGATFRAEPRPRVQRVTVGEIFANPSGWLR